MSRISGLFLLAIVVLGANQLLAATYAVGTCKPRLPSFTTITAAVTSVPAGSVIDVCPGTYAEQFTISQPLTLQGIATGNAARAVITVLPDLLTGKVQFWQSTFGEGVQAGKTRD